MCRRASTCCAQQRAVRLDERAKTREILIDFLHSRRAALARLGTQSGGMGGVSPPYKISVSLINATEMRHYIRGVYTPRAPRLGSQPASRAGMEEINLTNSNLPSAHTPLILIPYRKPK